MLGSALYFYNHLDIFIWVACLGPHCRDLLNKGSKESDLLVHSASFMGRETLYDSKKFKGSCEEAHSFLFET